MQNVELKPTILSHGRSGLKARGKRRNIIIYRSYKFCKTMSYFFQKTVGQAQNIAVTPMTTVSCMSHYTRGKSVGQDQRKIEKAKCKIRRKTAFRLLANPTDHEQ